MTEESESASDKSKEINVYTHKENLYTLKRLPTKKEQIFQEKQQMSFYFTGI